MNYIGGSGGDDRCGFIGWYIHVDQKLVNESNINALMSKHNSECMVIISLMRRC